jgi:hypothetical protein
MAEDPADAAAEGAGMAMTEQELRDQIHKRLTLNWLIQGASEHVGLTLHHLVRDEINAVHPRLIEYYDRFALACVLQYWRVQARLIFGSPRKFWRRASTDPGHPFYGHPLLPRYGGMLADTVRRRALERARAKGLTQRPVLFSLQLLRLVLRIMNAERLDPTRLAEIAAQAAASVWGIDPRRLVAQLEKQIVVGDEVQSRTLRGRVIRAVIWGINHLEWRGDELIVVARGVNWNMLVRELVKGVAELICLHGLNQLDDADYQTIIDTTDQLEYEPWMLQSGNELWRRVLAAAPDGAPIARVLMHLARLPAATLHSILADVIEDPPAARPRLAALLDEPARGSEM